MEVRLGDQDITCLSDWIHVPQISIGNSQFISFCSASADNSPVLPRLEIIDHNALKHHRLKTVELP